MFNLLDDLIDDTINVVDYAAGGFMEDDLPTKSVLRLMIASAGIYAVAQFYGMAVEDLKEIVGE